VTAQPYDALCNAVFQIPPEGSPSCVDPEDCMSDPSKYLYSNAAFTLLGRALEYRLGKTYEQLFAESIATPLGTQHMKGREEIDLDPAEVQLMVMGHHGTPAKPSTARMPGWPFGNPAGGMVASGDDMMKFLKWNLGKAASSLDSILPVVQTPLAAGARAGTQVAMGWEMAPKPGTGLGSPLPASYNYSKNGTSDTMSAFIAFNRDDDVGVFVLSNSLNFSATQLGQKLLEVLQ
jgi:CubicO group peptidase (beta-lactamase class C family)